MENFLQQNLRWLLRRINLQQQVTQSQKRFLLQFQLEISQQVFREAKRTTISEPMVRTPGISSLIDHLRKSMLHQAGAPLLGICLETAKSNNTDLMLFFDSVMCLCVVYDFE